jgi:hypothetical protein
MSQTSRKVLDGVGGVSEQLNATVISPAKYAYWIEECKLNFDRFYDIFRKREQWQRACDEKDRREERLIEHILTFSERVRIDIAI